MADPDQVAMLKRSVDEWKEWRSQNSGARDLRGADLRRANLIGVHFNSEDLFYADLRDAELECADLRGCDS